MTTATETYYTLTEVADILKLNVRSVRRMIKEPAVRGDKKGKPILKASNISTGSRRGIWRVAQSDLDIFMSSRKK